MCPHNAERVADGATARTQVLCKEGTNLLIPSPGFSLYRTLCAYVGIECRMYRLDPANNWQIDIPVRCMLARVQARQLTAAPTAAHGVAGGRQHGRRAGQQP